MEGPQKILIVEDEADLLELIHFNLAKEGYECRTAGDGEAALREIESDPPDAIILDRMLPRLSGDEVIGRLKRQEATASIPIVMLTAKAEESDELVGFALGADDYITKPFSIKLLIARVGAILRRRDAEAQDPGEQRSIGPVCINVARHEVRIDDRRVQLTTMEFRLLQTLVNAKGRVLSREQLIDAVLGPTVAVTDRTIDVHIAALRKKAAAAAPWIQTVRGVGYTFRAPE